MKLEEYILTYRGITSTGEDGIVCNIPDYYDKVIKPLDKRFSEYSFYNNRTVICPLHTDTDPSLGLIRHRFLQDVKVYHCFGCGASGTIIRLNQHIKDLYFNVKLTEEESCRDLAEIFGVSLDEFDSISEDDYDSKYVDTLKRINKAQSEYTVKDFSRNLLDIRKNIDINLLDKLKLLNSESVKIISTKKKLYS